MKARKLIAMLLVVATLMSFAPMAVFAAEGDTYVVDVQYVYAGGPLDGEYVATPWSGSYAHGSGDSRTITVPTAQGYTAQLAAVSSDVTASLNDKELTFSFENLSANKTILVEYVPAEVGMKVEFYQESLVEGAEDDLVETVTIAEAKTGDNIADYVSYTDGKIIVEGAEKKYSGFYGLWFDNTDTVAADGNTVVKVYFDREYYLLSFDLGGGYGVDPQFLRYGETVAEVGEPTRPGYTFEGWYTDAELTTEATVPAKMPAGNVKLYAKWTAVETAKVTIVYWGENANDEGYSYAGTGIAYMAPGSTVTATTATGIYFCGLEAHTHGTTCESGLVCTIAEHEAHTEACRNCGKTEHAAHTSDCLTCTTEEHSHSINCLWGYSCEKDEHTHSESNNCYKDTVHTHSDSCYSDVIHTHTTDCYNYLCGYEAHTHSSSCSTNSLAVDGAVLTNTDLWTYVKSDSATVAADGSTVINVYYDRTAKTLTFKYNKGSGSLSYTETITAKWGEKIADEFVDITTNAGGTFWTLNSNGTSGPFTNYFGVMPQANATYYNGGKNGDNGSMYYWGQDQSGEYTVKLYETPNVGGYYVTVEDRYEFEGFTYSHGTDLKEDCEGATFYYTRNSYDLVYISGGVELRRDSVKYEASLAGKDAFTPSAAPAYLEAGAYVFGGWYSNPECTIAFDFANSTMPAKNVTVYAKWVPVTHNVTVYLDADAAKAGTDPISAQTVSHRDFATEPENVSNEPYAFVAWFYVDENGNEKAFDFGSMQITRDTVVYAKWKATNPVAYTVKFQLADGTAVAEPINGMALPFTTVTEEAKVGEELNAAYQEGYFPNIASQSIVISGTGVNEIIFIYAPAENVPYTVRYLEEGTGKVLKQEKVVPENKKSVVTETAAFISGYMADSYQKRLILTTGEGAENIITFYYTADTENTLVIIEHILDDRNFQDDFSQTPEKKGTVITASAKTIGGYVFDHVDIYYLDGTVIRENVKDATVTETLDLKGLHIVFHYIPNEFYVHHQSDGSVETYKLPEYEAFDVTEVVYAGYIYGGLYDSTFTTPYDSEALADAYKNKPADGMNLKPVAGERYYLKEVHEDYVSPGIYRVWNDAKADKPLHRLYLITAVDSLNYLETGVELNWVDAEGKVTATEIHNTATKGDNKLTGNGENPEDSVHSKFAVTFHNTNYQGTTTTEYYANDIFGSYVSKDGYLYIHNFSEEFLKKTGETIQYNAYHVTPDGIRVTGVRTRTLINVDGTDTNLSKDVTRGTSICSKYEAQNGVEAVEFAPLTLRSTYSIRGDVVYSITKVDGKNTEVQIAMPGDQTGTIGYTEKAGYVFAGWYTDKACTKPADFSDIQSDMTVYPKYVSAKQVTTKTTALGKLMTVNVSVPGTDLTQVGVSYTLDGETTNVLCKKSQSLISGLKKLLGSKSTTYTASWNMKGLTNGDTFTVTSYWVTADGTMVEIETKDFAYSRNRISVQ